MLYNRVSKIANKQIRFENLQSYKVHNYKPIIEYVGWGIRSGKKGRTFNVSGNRGVLFHLVDGSSILLGSQRPDELYKAVDRASGSLIQ